MAKKNIGATLSIKDGNFTTGIKNAVTGLKNLKNHTTNATGNLKKFGTQSKSTGDTLSWLAKKGDRCSCGLCRIQSSEKFYDRLCHRRTGIGTGKQPSRHSYDERQRHYTSTGRRNHQIRRCA